VKRAIDWRAVEFVLSGAKLKLTGAEKRMVIRRVAHRMLDNTNRRDHYHSPATAALITTDQMAELMMTTGRSVQRIKDELRPADKRTCPVCGEPMWVYSNGFVEAHPDRLSEECELSGTALPPPPRGLAALRPDLYRWAVTA
jgi:hypothetical protein